MSDGEKIRFRDSLLAERLRSFATWCVLPAIVGGVAGFVGVALARWVL